MNTETSSVKVPAMLLKAAMLNQAKGDVRYYLNGIHIDKENGRVCGTNGHTLFVGNSELFSNFDESMIISISGTIPARAINAHFVNIREGCGYIHFTGNKSAIQASNGAHARCFYDVIEGKFPDVDKLIKEKELVAVEKIGVNPKYLDLLNKISKCMGSKGSMINFRGNNESIDFKIMHTDYDCHYIVMPMRV